MTEIFKQEKPSRYLVLSEHPINKTKHPLNSVQPELISATDPMKSEPDAANSDSEPPPATMDELTHLAGVGRKTANVVLGNAFDVPGITVDTHVGRLSRRLGLTIHEDPVKVETDLMDVIPKDEWTMFSHRMIFHGRQDSRAECQLEETVRVGDEEATRHGRRVGLVEGCEQGGQPTRI